MNDITLAPGETARYEYDPRSDSLYIELMPDSTGGEFVPIAEMPQVDVRHAPDGRLQAMAVKGVQTLILQHLVRDLVAMARDRAAADSSMPNAAPGGAGVVPSEARISGQGTGPADTPAPKPEQAAQADEAEAAKSPGEPGAPQRSGKRKRRGRGRRPPTDDVAADARDGSPQERALAPDDVADTLESSVTSTPEAPELDPQEPGTAIALEASALDGSVTSAPEDPSPEEPAPEELPLEAEGPDGAHELPGAATVDPVDVPKTADRPSRPSADAETPEAFRGFGLEPRVGAALAAMGFTEPTPIQNRAIPIVMSQRDVVGLAQTGTGKTVAFLAPALHRLLTDSDSTHRSRLLVVTPTRELAVQIGHQVETLTQFTQLRLAVVYGGAGMKPQVDALRKGADVIVATPGRLLDHVRRGNARLQVVQVLVLDEADRMLDMGFMPDVRRILERLPEERQTLLFGATLPPDIESLSRKFQRDPEVVEVARQLPPATLEQTLYPVGRHLKIPLLTHLLKTDAALSRVLVFTETKVETDIVARKVSEAGLKVASMHGDRPQHDRERALRQLQDGEVQVLVATNVAARGLDIEDVTHVVNYDMPQTVDDYVHRIGRTARGAAEGMAYTFVTIGDESMVLRIQSALGRSLPRVLAEGFDYDVPTPSWAQPSSQDVARALYPPSLSNASRSFHPRRR